MASSPKLTSRCAPDGGWGWVAVIGGFIFMMIIPSLNRSFSLINGSWQHQFSASPQATSGAFSLYSVLSTVSGPLCSYLVDRFGCQRVNMAGGVLITLGLLGSGLAPNLYAIYFTFGVLVGLGRGLVETGKEICFASWFDKNRAKATGFSAVSTGLGTMGMAPLIQICSDEFGTSGAMIILAGLGAHIVLAGMLMREPHPWEARDYYVSATASEQEQAEVKEDEGAEKNINLNKHNTQVECIIKLTDANGNKLVKFQSCVSKTGDDKYCVWPLLRNTSFLAYCLMMGTGTGSISLVNSYFAGFSLQRGIHMRTSSYLIASTGAILIICRLLTGICLDMPSVRAWRKEIMGLHSFVMGAALVVMAFTPGTLGFILPFALFIVAQSITGIQYGVVLSDIIDRKDYTWALGVLRLCRGVGFLLGPLVGGVLKDVTGKYDMSFLFGGLLSLLPSAVFLATMVYHWRKSTACEESSV